MADRYTRRGKAKIRLAATLADTTFPQVATSAEITGATPLQPQIAEIGGMRYSNEPITTPDLDTTFDTQIPGADTVDAPTLTFYDTDEATPAARTALAKGTTGFLLLFPQGVVVGRRMEIWPVTSTGFNDEWSAGNDPARSICTMAVTGRPTQDFVIPTGST